MAKKTNGKFDVGGVLLAQPFKIRRLGHFGLNVPDPRPASISTARGWASASPTRSTSPSITPSATS